MSRRVVAVQVFSSLLNRMWRMREGSERHNVLSLQPEYVDTIVNKP